jgi:hypothetical protein
MRGSESGVILLCQVRVSEGLGFTALVLLLGIIRICGRVMFYRDRSTTEHTLPSSPIDHSAFRVIFARLEKVGAPKILLPIKAHRTYKQTTMAAKQISFSHIESAPELAKVLNVDANTLYCTSVIVLLTICTVYGCVYPALLRNGQRGHSAGPRCAVHRRDWFPTPGKRGSLVGSRLCPASRIVVTTNHGTLVLRLSTKVTSLGKKAFGAL